jgi:hypothetical protein
MDSPQASVEYSQDFESKGPNESPSKKYDGDFEPFESDANSMLLFGNAIDLTDNGAEDIPGTSPLPGEEIMDKYGDGFDASVDDLDASAEYEKLLSENPETAAKLSRLLEEDVDDNLDGHSLSMDSSVSIGAIGDHELDEQLLSDEENSIDQLISDLNESTQGANGSEMSRQLSIKKLLELQEREEQKAKEDAIRKQQRKANKKALKPSVGINSKPTLIPKGSSRTSSKSSKVSSMDAGNVSAGNSIVSGDSSVSTINTLPQAVLPPKSAGMRPATTKSGSTSRSNTRTGARPPGSRGVAGSRVSSRGPGSRGMTPLFFDGAVGDTSFNPISQAPVTSHIGHDTKHDKAILERELDNAYKRIALYASENEKLRARLDHSALQHEFDTMKDILEQQDEKIEKLTDDKRGLEKITRAQGKSLIAMQHKQVADGLVTGPALRIPVHKPAPYNNHYPPRHAQVGLGASESSDSHPAPVHDPRDIQIRILIQRVRRNQLQIKDLRTKDKTTSRSLKKAEKSNAALKEKVVSLTNSLNELAMHYNNNIAMVQQQGLQGDSVISSTSKGGEPYGIHMAGGGNGAMNEGSSVFVGGSSIIGGGGSSVIDGSSVLGVTLSNVQDSVATAHTVHALQHDVRKLQSIIDRQRISHMKQISGLRNALLHSQETKLKMQDEFMTQERTIKSQIAVVKQLKETCEELADANQRLLMASDFYTHTSRPQQPPSPQPAPPSQPAMSKSFTRPVPKPALVGTQHLSRPKAPVMSHDYVVHGIESPGTTTGPFSPYPESTDSRDNTFLTNSQD